MATKLWNPSVVCLKYIAIGIFHLFYRECIYIIATGYEEHSQKQQYKTGEITYLI